MQRFDLFVFNSRVGRDKDFCAFNLCLASQEAALRYDTKTPRYLHIASNKTNRWGQQRSYRLQVLSATGDHLPESQPEERAMSWAR